MEAKEPSFFERFGLQVSEGEVEIGQTYPIYGMLTQVIDDTPGSVIVEINFSIKANMFIPDAAKIEILKERAFEPGIFVSTVLTKDPKVEVSCHTVVFGKRQNFNA